MKMDYVKFAGEILGVLDELGNPMTLRVPSLSSLGKTGKNPVVSYTEYEGTGVQGRYDDSDIYDNGPIKAGDVKFVVQFDTDIVPEKSKKNQVEYGGVIYNVIDVSPVIPNGTDVVVYILQARRLN